MSCMTVKFSNRYFNDYAKKFKLNIHYNTRVEKISRDKDGESFQLRTEKGVLYKAQVLIMATGAMVENMPDMPGADLCATYATHTTNQKLYENKKVAIVGGGNSGFEV